MKTSKADIMFEELGYEIETTTLYADSYIHSMNTYCTKEYQVDGVWFTTRIHFDSKNKDVMIESRKGSSLTNVKLKAKESLAICEKLKELGWI